LGGAALAASLAACLAACAAPAAQQPPANNPYMGAPPPGTMSGPPPAQPAAPSGSPGVMVGTWRGNFILEGTPYGSAYGDYVVRPDGSFEAYILNNTGARCTQRGTVTVQGDLVTWYFAYNDCNRDYEGRTEVDRITERRGANLILVDEEFGSATEFIPTR
jgi:hypothetical protein